MGFGEVNHQPRYRVPTSRGLTFPRKVSWLSRKSCWRPAPMMNFWVDAPFFFDMCFFFWRAEVWGSQLVLFLYRWGFKVGNTHHWIHLEEFEFSSSFFFSDVLEVTWPSLMRILGDTILRSPWEFTQKMGGCWCFRVFPRSEWFMGCCTPPNEALCSCKTTETLDFWFGHKFYSLRGADCWTSWNWSTFAGRAFCGILPAKVWVGCEGVDLEHRGRRNARETDCYGFWGQLQYGKNAMLDFKDTDALTLKQWIFWYLPKTFHMDSWLILLP